MNVKRTFPFLVIITVSSLFLSLTPISLAASIKSGTACTKLGAIKIYQGKKYTCVKEGNKVVWNTGVLVAKGQPTPEPTQKPTPTPTPTPTFNPLAPATKASLRYWGAPSVYDLRNERSLSFELSLDTDGIIDTPKITANFTEPYKTWEIPAQSKSITTVVTPVSVDGFVKTYKVTLSIDARQAIGSWNWTISPITVSGKTIGSIKLDSSSSSFDFRREFYGAGSAVARTAGTAFTYESFKGQKFQLYPWEGRNVVLLTKTTNHSPEVMGRILYTLDKAFDTYRSTTQYSPSQARTFNSKLTIGVLAADEIGCGAACGFLGATGIELSQPLFNRLYNGVEKFDQYDQTLFYELGRNFWDYAGIQKVLTKGGNGSWTSDPFWDVSTTGFADYMRALTVEVNNIPMQPWDGNNTNWQAFFDEMKSLAFMQIESSTSNFSNTFQAKKPPYSGALGATDFWASIMFYFSEGKDKEVFTRTFLQSLKQQRTPTSTAQVVENFVQALTIATGSDASDTFYKILRFQDARQLP